MKEITKQTDDGKVIMVDMRRHILHVACSLMTSKGIKETSLKDITTELLSFLDDSSQNMEPAVIMKALFEKILAQETRGRLHFYLLNNVSANGALKDKFFRRYESWRAMLEAASYFVD